MNMECPKCRGYGDEIGGQGKCPVCDGTGLDIEPSTYLAAIEDAVNSAKTALKGAKYAEFKESLRELLRETV